jgi:uncharacterized protein (DUF1800 family)
MLVSRRRFLSTSATIGAAVTVGAVPNAHAAPHTITLDSTAIPPSPVMIALNRMAYGPRPGDIERVRSMGLPAYINEQLAPATINDSACDQRLAARNYKTLNLARGQMWTQYHDLPAWNDRLLPWREVRDATWIRAVYSKCQLQEVLVEFWYNHFNVHATSSSDIACTWPDYDRTLRTHSLGNFRALLEEVAKSTAMLLYLDNASSHDGPANENYARELFELHTLGAEHYYNHLYDDVINIPRYADGRPQGYIDQDIYEAADCFTGWTVDNGAWNGSGHFPDTGEFHYYHPWHDDRPTKIVLSPNGRPNIRAGTIPMADGRAVLDLLASHPATAEHLCRKLCRRLIADTPPQALVDRAAQVWLGNASASDQIARVVRTILESPEFMQWGDKIKRPFEYVASYLRVTNAEFTPSDHLFWSVQATGYRLFEWPTPTGHPDTADAWLNPNTLLRMWNLSTTLFEGWFGAATFALQKEIPSNVTTSTQIVDFWLDRMLGRPVAAAHRTALIDFLRSTRGANEPPQPEPANDPGDLTTRINQLVALIARMPEYLEK